MNTTTHSSSRRRTTLQVTGVASIALLWLTLAAGTAQAEAPDEPWHISTPFYLAAGAHYYSNGRSSGAFNTMTVYVEAVLSSRARPYSAGLFVDYSFSPDSREDGTVNAGGLLEYEIHNWDASAYAFNSKSQGDMSMWLYAGRIRRRIAENHKIGIEVVGLFRDPPASKVMIGYYGTISRSLSFNLAAGAALNSGHDRAVNAVLVWQIN